VDGIHLDYIRYPYDYYLVADELYADADAKTLRLRSDFSHDRFTKELLSTSDKSKQRYEMQCEIISRLVARMAEKIEMISPQIVFSASVLGNPVDGRIHAAQKPERWLAEHGLDWAVQMNYSDSLFSTHAEAFRKIISRKDRTEGWMMGLLAEHDKRSLKRQLQALPDSDCYSIAIFSYSLLYEHHQPTDKSRFIRDFLSRNLQEATRFD
jgi:uncharacterized lipoprotein YddW (UPF0748 family)